MSEHDALRNGEAENKFESPRSLDVVIEEQGDTTPRPLREELRRQLERRGRLARRQPAPESPGPNGTEPPPK